MKHVVNFCMQILNSSGFNLGNRLSEVESLTCSNGIVFSESKGVCKDFFSSLSQSIGNYPI